MYFQDWQDEFDFESPNDCQPEDPTPEEIRQACLLIQASWSEQERRYRAGIRDGWWPVFSM